MPGKIRQRRKASSWDDVETIFHSESATWEQAGRKFNIALLCEPRTVRRVPVAKEIRRADAIKVEMSCLNSVFA